MFRKNLRAARAARTSNYSSTRRAFRTELAKMNVKYLFCGFKIWLLSNEPLFEMRGNLSKWELLFCLTFLAGLDRDIDKFFIFTLTLLLASLCASSIAFFVSACVRTFAIANLLVGLPYVFMMVSWRFFCVVYLTAPFVFTWSFSTVKSNRFSSCPIYDKPKKLIFLIIAHGLFLFRRWIRVARSKNQNMREERKKWSRGKWRAWRVSRFRAFFAPCSLSVIESIARVLLFTGIWWCVDKS